MVGVLYSCWNCIVIIHSFTVINYGLTQLVGHAPWGCWIHLYKTFMLRSCFPNRLHNTWTEWQFYGGGSLYIFIYNKWCLKREITLHVHTISQRHEISYMRQCCQYGLWKLEWSCWVPARMCVGGVGMLMWAASLLYKKYISKYMISVLNLCHL